MTIRILGPNDVRLFREIRLAGLANDPRSFGSNHERESAFDDDAWATRLASFAGRPGVVFASEDPAGATGIAGIGLAEDPSLAMLWGMWVRPEARRSGVAGQLVLSSLAWARDRSVGTVTLTVYPHNTGAIELYRSLGFASENLPDSDDITMTKRI